MVQILREQTRQYAADKTEAIETAQMAQSMGDWASTVKSAASIGKSVEKEIHKNRVNADQNIINAQIGQQAGLLADRDIQKEVVAGTLNPDTEEGRKRIDEIVASHYEKYKGLGKTTEYENALTKMQRSSSDKGLKNAFATYDKIQKANARVSAEKISKGFGEEAYKQGLTGQNQEIEGVDQYIKFVASDKGIPEEQARVLVEGEMTMAKLRGIIDSDPVLAAQMLGDEEIIKDAHLIQHPEDIDKKDLQIDNTKGSEELKNILGENYFNAVKDAQTSLLTAQKKGYEIELKKVPANSPVAKKYKEKIEGINEQLENPDDSAALGLVRSDFLSYNNQELHRALKESYARFKQDVKVDSYDNTWKLYSTALDTDVESAKRAQTEIWLAQNDLIPMTPIESQMMSDFNGEVDKKEMIDSYHEFLENSTKVKPELHETYEATMGIHDLVQEMFEPDLTPMQLVKKGYDVLNKAAHTNCTDGQLKNVQSLVAKIIQDKGFGDLASSVMNSVDRAWFDESFVGDFAEQNSSSLVPQFLWTSNKADKMALPKGSEYRTTKDAVQRMVQSEGQKVTNYVMKGLIDSYNLPEAERTQKIQELQNYVVDAKRSIYNKAMKNYGIDLNYLDNELRVRGRAYVNVNGILREYKGRDSEQRALWDTPKRNPVEQSQLDKLFERVKNAK